MMNERQRSVLGGGPRIALVLGSGGVRGVAGLGIYDVLVRAGLKPDLIVGCSSGALFGASIAYGMSSAEALRAATSLWSQELTEQRRWRAYLELLLPKLTGFGAGFSLRDARLIESRLVAAFGTRGIESLPIALRVVTTDAGSGDSVVLTRGRLSTALLASMAVPFLFPSVVFNDRRLVDGVVSNPLPVSVADDASVVIALGFRGGMPRRVDRPSRLLAQVSTAMINNLQAAQLRAAEARGQQVIAIDVPVDRRIGIWDTRAMPRIFDLGVQATLQRLDEIRARVAAARSAAAA